MDVWFCVPYSSELISSPTSSGHAETGLSLHSHGLGHNTVVRHRGRSIKTFFRLCETSAYITLFPLEASEPWNIFKT